METRVCKYNEYAAEWYMSVFHYYLLHWWITITKALKCKQHFNGWGYFELLYKLFCSLIYNSAFYFRRSSCILYVCTYNLNLQSIL